MLLLCMLPECLRAIWTVLKIIFYLYYLIEKNFHHICWSCIYPPQTLPRSSHSPSIQFHHLCFTLCLETCINMFVCIHKHIFKRYHNFQYVWFFSTVLDNLITMLLKILDLAKYFFYIQSIDYAMIFYFILSIYYVDLLL